MKSPTGKALEAFHYLQVLVVFAITGSLTVMLSKLLLQGLFGLEGSFFSGPWSFRVGYLLTIPPSYSVILVVIGTLFGKRQYFTLRVLRIWGRPLRLLRRVSPFNPPAPPRGQ